MGSGKTYSVLTYNKEVGMERKSFLILAAIFLSMDVSSVYAETVVLKSGKEIKGSIVEKTEQYIKMQVDGVPATFWLDEIARVEEDAPVSSEVATPETAVNYSDIEKYMQEGNYASIVSVIEKAIETEPGNVDFYIVTGISHYYLGDYEKSISSFQKALSLQPESGELGLCLGISYDAAGRKEEAKEAISKAIGQFKNKMEMMDVFVADFLLAKISNQ
jgi:hypothetical protein